MTPMNTDKNNSLYKSSVTSVSSVALPLPLPSPIAA